MKKKSAYKYCLCVLIIVLLIIPFPGHAVDKDETAFLVTVRCFVTIWVPVQKICDEKVQYRKEGRWYYVDKKVPCWEKVPAKKIVTVSDVIGAPTYREALNKIVDHFQSKGYENIILVSMTLVK